MSEAQQPNQFPAPDDELLDGPTSIVPAVKNPRIKYTLVYPNGERVSRGGVIVGYVSDLRAQEEQLLHGEPILTQVENLRVVGRLGREIPLEQQPPLFRKWHDYKAKLRARHGYDAKRRGAGPLKDEHHRAALSLAMERPHLRELIDDNGGDTRGLRHPGVQPPREEAPSGTVYEDDDQRAFAKPIKEFDGTEWNHPTLPDPRDVREPAGPVGPESLNVKPIKKK